MKSALRALLFGAAQVIFWGSVLCGLGVIGWQAAGWVDTGEWREFSAIDVMYWFHQADWLWYPRKLVGIHKTLSAMNGGVFIVIAGAMCAALFATLSADFE